MANETMCRLCGNEPVDPNTGSYELCGSCWNDFMQDMEELGECERLADLDEWESYFMAANPEFDDYPL